MACVVRETLVAIYIKESLDQVWTCPSGLILQRLFAVTISGVHVHMDPAVALCMLVKSPLQIQTTIVTVQARHHRLPHRKVHSRMLTKMVKEPGTVYHNFQVQIYPLKYTRRFFMVTLCINDINPLQSN